MPLNSQVSVPNDSGRVQLDFVDALGAVCVLMDSDDARSRLWLGLKPVPMMLDQHTVRELLPLLQHFLDHGKLPS
jgi:hypothetical protein